MSVQSSTIGSSFIRNGSDGANGSTRAWYVQSVLCYLMNVSITACFAVAVCAAARAASSVMMNTPCDSTTNFLLLITSSSSGYITPTTRSMLCMCSRNSLVFIVISPRNVLTTTN